MFRFISFPAAKGSIPQRNHGPVSKKELGWDCSGIGLVGVFLGSLKEVAGDTFGWDLSILGSHSVIGYQDHFYLEDRVFFFLINLFIYLFLAVLGLCCCAQAFSSCGTTLHCGARASHCGDFSCCGAQALGVWASVVVARRLSSCGSRALELRLCSCGARA